MYINWMQKDSNHSYVVITENLVLLDGFYSNIVFFSFDFSCLLLQTSLLDYFGVVNKDGQLTA